jgi:hypothetical protein
MSETDNHADAASYDESKCAFSLVQPIHQTVHQFGLVIRNLQLGRSRTTSSHLKIVIIYWDVGHLENADDEPGNPQARPHFPHNNTANLGVARANFHNMVQGPGPTNAVDCPA